MSTTPAPERIALPRLPAGAAPFRFPILATTAPIAGAVVMFAVTGSPFMLVFAALGPLTAVASLVDARFGARRDARRETSRFLKDLDRVRDRVREAHDLERAERLEHTPGAPALLARRGADPGRWASPGPVVPVVLGVGAMPSALRVEPPPIDATVPSDLEGPIVALLTEAATLDRTVVVVDAVAGVGIVGPAVLTQALARSLVVQAAWTISPATATCSWSGDEAWLGELPHRRIGAPRRGQGLVVEFENEQAHEAVVIATAETPELLPRACRVVVRVGGGAPAEIVRHPQRSERRSFEPVFLTREETATWARRASRDAGAEGIGRGDRDLPASARLAAVLDGELPQGGLAARFAMGVAGPLAIDLVNDGPHAIVGGTTGSGKSELLIAWVTAIAAAHAPDRVNFLLVDFKGGAAFAPLSALPHTVGIITDLDESGASRALASLRAELRYRERELASAGVRDIDHMDALPRLVIVVDEFAAMMAIDPDLHALFADIAARGRSLGVHLVLCTQRPAGVVRDAVLANADLRMSLRVNNRADSEAVIGTPGAADLPALPRGRAIVRLAGREPVCLQVALAEPTDIASIASRWSGATAPRRPWCDPLPASVRGDDLAQSTGTPIGLLDVPEEQRIETATFVAERDGHVLVLGGAASGKSMALLALTGDEETEWMPTSPAAAWDVLEGLVGALDGTRSGPSRLVVADDLDSLIARFAEEYRGALLERLGRLLREGPALGLHMLYSAQRISTELQALASLTPSRLLLRMPNRDEHLLAGGERATWSPALPQGGGTWHGHRVQIVLPKPRRIESAVSRAEPVEQGRSLAIVTPRAGALTEQLRSAGYTTVVLGGQDAGAAPRDLVTSAAGPVAVLGDPEEWQSRWGALGAARGVADILFDGCTIAEFRALTRSRLLPPPLEPGQYWSWLEHGGVARAHRLPA